MLRILVIPFEWFVEERAGVFEELREILAATSQRCARRKALQSSAFGGHHPVADATEQHRDLGSGGAVIDMRFVQGDGAPVAARLAVEQGTVTWSEQQVLEHREVREQDRRRLVLHLLAR